MRDKGWSYLFRILIETCQMSKSVARANYNFLRELPRGERALFGPPPGSASMELRRCCVCEALEPVQRLQR